MATASCRLRADDYRALQEIAYAQDSSPAMIIRRLIGAYLATAGALPDASPIWRELRIDKLVTPFFKRKSWEKDAKKGLKAIEIRQKIIKMRQD